MNYQLKTSTMELNFYKKMKHISTFLVLIVSILMSTSVMAQWTVYDAGVLPNEHEDIEFSTSNRQNLSEEEFYALNSIVDDVDKTGNEILNFYLEPDFETYPDGQRGMWRVDFDETAETVTIVTRLKAAEPLLDWTMDIDIEVGGAREQIFIQNDNTMRLRRGPDETYDFPEGFDVAEWNIYRIVVDGSTDPKSVKIYLNEENEPFIEAEPGAGGNSYVRFSSGDRNKTVGYDMDWMAWDNNGAFAPGEGEPIPVGLFPPEWTVYDGNSLPNEYEGVEFSTSNRQNLSEEEFYAVNSIVNDPLIPDNKLLKFYLEPDFETYPDGQRGMWRVDFDETAETATIVTRLKAAEPLLDWTMDIDIEVGGAREQIFIQNDNTIRLRRGPNETYDFPEGFNVAEWNVYRIVVDGSTDPKTVEVYLNEETTPFISTEPGVGGNSYVRFSSGDRNKNVGYDMDWMIWDVTGAYAPDEGMNIPESLHLYAPDLATWEVYDATVLPNEHEEIDFKTANIMNLTEEEFYAVNTIIDDEDIPGNKLLNFYLEPDFDTYPDGQRGMWRVDFDEATEQVTIVTRLKAAQPLLDWTLDIDVEAGGAREQIFIQNDNTMRLRRGTGDTYDLPENFDVAEWNLYRIVINGAADPKTVAVYLNEETEPFVEAEAGAGSNSYVRFASGDRNKTVGFDMDWMIWDETGAFAPGEGWTIPAGLSVNPLDDNEASLADLTVDGETIIGFEAGVLNYEVERPSGLEMPVVDANPSVSVAMVDIVNVEELPGDAVVTVTSRNGQASVVYRITFIEVASTSDATLAEIHINGEPLEGFNSQVVNYDVVLPFGTSEDNIPELDAVPNVEGAGYVATQATTLPGDATIEVTALDGETVLLYTVSFTVAEPSDDASLASILVNDELVEGFHPDSTYYTVILPFDTEEINIVAETTNQGAVADISQPTNNNYIIEVTAEDATATMTYYVMVVIAEEVISEWNIYDATVLPLEFQPPFEESNGTLVNSTLIDDEEDAGNSFLELVTQQVGHTGMWRMDFGGQLPSEAVTIVFRVKAANDEARRVVELDVQQGGFRERIYINREENRVRLNETLMYDGEGNPLTGDNKEISMPEGQSVSNWHIYRLAKNGDQVRLFVDEVEVPFAEGTTITRTNEDYFRFGGGNSSHNIGALVDWVIWDISGAYAPGEGTPIPEELNTQVGPPPTGKDASLTDLTLDGTTIEGFSALSYDYSIVLPHGSTIDDVPEVGAIANIEEASVEITQASELPGTATVVVTSVDLSVVNTYTIAFRAASNDATLSSLMIDGAVVEGFDPGTTYYNVELPEGTRLIPVVTAVLSDANASREITQAADLPGEATVVVTAEDGETIISYTVEFTFTTNVNEFYKNTISLYPNPVDDKLTLKLANELIGADVRITNAMGQIVKQQIAGNIHMNVDVSDLAGGIYMVTILKDNINVSKRITKY
jgi:hypothetical protein